MTNYAYKRNIPASANNPSNDQSPLRTNTNSVDSLIAEDHYSFGVANGGLHKQMRIIDLLATPGSRATGMGTLWTENTTTTGAIKESELFYVPDNTSDRYQLTRTISGKKSLFSTNTIYQAAAGTKPSTTGGWSFLPGGMLIQYGISTNANLSTNNAVEFPVPFMTFVGSIVLTPVRNNSNDKVVAITTGSISNAGFTFILSGSSQPTSITWMAIGV